MPGLLRGVGAVVALSLLTACESPIDFKSPQGVQVYNPRTPVSGPGTFGPPGGVAPPPGRTPAERQARKDYYSGPRGEEF